MHDGVLTSVMKSYIFQVSLIVLKDFSRLFHTSDHFPHFSRPISILNSMTFQSFPGSVITGRMPFLSRNKHCQSTERQSKHRPQAWKSLNGLILSSSNPRLLRKGVWTELKCRSMPCNAETKVYLSNLKPLKFVTLELKQRACTARHFH